MTQKLGPGVLVAAAFTLAGANFGFALVWALVFATIATIILQDMAARLGAGAQLGLGEALMQSASIPAIKWFAGNLLIGNAAYEGGDQDRKSKLFRGTALFVVVVGAAISLSGIKPASLILIAQYANVLLLPIMAAFLLWVMNLKDLPGAHTNSALANIAGVSVVLITLGFGLRSILRAAGIWA